jgi:hypothetical protein
MNIPLIGALKDSRKWGSEMKVAIHNVEKNKEERGGRIERCESVFIEEKAGAMSSNLPPLSASSIASSQLVQFRLERFDTRVSLFQVFVESVSFGNEMLLPLSESLLLQLDLLGKSPSKGFFLLFELGIVQLLDFGLSELTGLHLCLSICFVMSLFRCVDEVQHVGSDQKRSELLEVAMFLILNCDRGREKGEIDSPRSATLSTPLVLDNHFKRHSPSATPQT